MTDSIPRKVARAAFVGLMSAFWLGLPCSPIGAQNDPIVIKLATLAPRDSEFHEFLKDLSTRWDSASGGQVRVSIFPGGIVGEEEDVLRKMRIGQLHAGTLTIAGLQRVTPAITVLAIPMAMDSEESFARVRAIMEPRLEEIFLEEGYVVLHWVHAGWCRFFLPSPDASLRTVQEYSFVTWGEGETVDLWGEAGFRGVVLNLADVTVGLQTGLVDALNTAPLVVISNQWFPWVPYMIDMPWAPLSGATVVDRRTWERVPEHLRPELLEIARETGEGLEAAIMQLEVEAIEEMKARGLNVVQPPPEVILEWRRFFEGAYPSLRGPVIPEGWFDEALVAARGGR
jgi:TRAP-type C4-dicarboxylate transport system substrate-binding protein